MLNSTGEARLVFMFEMVWARRRWLAKVAGIGLIAATIIAFVIPKEYRSTAQLMPPDAQTLSNTSVLAAMAGNALPSGGAAGMASGLLGQSSPGATVVGVLQSRTVADDIIKRFDLLHVYHLKYMIDARKKLAKRSLIQEDKKSGIITITVTDDDPNRARQIAQTYVDDLSTLIVQLSTSSARLERIFLEGRLKTAKQELDASTRALSEFSSHNATLNIQGQGMAMISEAATLQGQLITAEAELHSLQAIYSVDNTRVQAAQARVNTLRNNLQKLSGSDERQGQGSQGDLTPDALYPSLRKLPLLGVAYYDLYRRTSMEEATYESLNKEYEIARVEEAKETPTIKILDEPNLPVKKSFPPRALIIALGLVCSVLGGITWILGCEYWVVADQSTSSLKACMMVVRRSMAEKDPVTAAPGTRETVAK